MPAPSWPSLATAPTITSARTSFLDEIEQQGGVQPGQAMSTVCMALWLGALTATMKCFRHSDSRTEKLDADRIFGTDTTRVRAAFDRLKALRNKHVVHDENDWMQSLPIAIVASPGHQPVVSGIDCLLARKSDERITLPAPPTVNTPHTGSVGQPR